MKTYDSATAALNLLRTILDEGAEVPFHVGDLIRAASPEQVNFLILGALRTREECPALEGVAAAWLQTRSDHIKTLLAVATDAGIQSPIRLRCWRLARGAQAFENRHFIEEAAVRLLADPCEPLRLSATEVASHAYWSGKAMSAEAERLMRDPSPRVRAASCGLVRSSLGTEQLEPLLDDPEPEVRIEAIRWMLSGTLTIVLHGRHKPTRENRAAAAAARDLLDRMCAVLTQVVEAQYPDPLRVSAIDLLGRSFGNYAAATRTLRCLAENDSSLEIRAAAVACAA